MTSDTRDSGYTVHPPLLGRDRTYSDENEYAYVEDYQRFNTPSTPDIQQGPTALGMQQMAPSNVGPATPPRPVPGTIQAHATHRDNAPPTGSSPELYNSLDGSQHRYREERHSSPARVIVPNAYHVLDVRDDVTRLHVAI